MTIKALSNAESKVFLEKILETIQKRVRERHHGDEGQRSSIPLEGFMDPNFTPRPNTHYKLLNPEFQTYTLELLNISVAELNLTLFSKLHKYIEKLVLSGVATNSLSIPSHIACDINLITTNSEFLFVHSPPNADVVRIRIDEYQGVTPKRIIFSNTKTHNKEIESATSLISIINSICPCTITGLHQTIKYMGRSNWIECNNAKITDLNIDSNFFRKFSHQSLQTVLESPEQNLPDRCCNSCVNS